MKNFIAFIISLMVIAVITIVSGYNYIVKEYAYSPYNRPYKASVQVYTPVVEEETTTALASNEPQFYITSEYGMLTVYKIDDTVYDKTTIKLKSLSYEQQVNVLNRLYFNTEEALFGFLETYTS